MHPYNLMTYSGVMGEWKRRPRYYRPAFRFDKGVVQPDKSWQVVLLVAAVAFGFCVMFVRWWLFV